MLRHGDLLRHVKYDPETGQFTRLIAPPRAKYSVGQTLGHAHSAGYVGIALLGRVYLAHRLAWFYMTGSWPDKEVDHINRVRSDNRWNNLRAATRQQNIQNNSPSRRGALGVRGVYWWSRDNKWAARIKCNGKENWLGLHDTLVDAVAARYRAEKAMYSFSPLVSVK